MGRGVAVALAALAVVVLILISNNFSRSTNEARDDDVRGGVKALVAVVALALVLALALALRSPLNILV